MAGSPMKTNITKMYLPGGTRDITCLTSLGMILAETLTREEALKELEQDPYSPEKMQEDKEYIAKKLGITAAEFDHIIDGPNKTYKDYRNSWKTIQLGTMILRKLGIEKKKFR